MGFDRYRYLDISLQDGIALVSMGNPVGPDFVELEHPMHTELHEIWADLAADSAVAGVVLTGTGDTFFTGPTLEALHDLITAKPNVVIGQMEEARGIVERVLDFPKPLVAAVNGPAVSIGCQLAFLSDEAVASSTARFQDTHIRLGLAAGDGGTWMWPLLIGYARARRFLLRSHPLSASDALELGLVCDVVPPDNVVAAALEIARKLTRLPAFAFRATKRALAQSLRVNALLSADASAASQMATYLTPEFIEMLKQRLGDNSAPAGSQAAGRAAQQNR
ncbi:enoyl-CoA hydratase/isomerase family protein [Mycobacterium branderi]|uniref:enoyl-CoA hydratase/isomerase family protein n=1 Tax=Mycobacterium branderi TaxID=43348 RepID=UPI0013D6757F|nr:enoyl-CoA hydratase-related protein [Mycobacterium branderi]MCV7231861.1 enoyl-CoA hydratase/isomerase family protein [Mycobacterium branderi]